MFKVIVDQTIIQKIAPLQAVLSRPGRYSPADSLEDNTNFGAFNNYEPSTRYYKHKNSLIFPEEFNKSLTNPNIV